jgi:hypothetical protein
MTRDDRVLKGAGLALLVVALFPIKYALVQSPWWFVLTFVLAALGIAILLKKSNENAQEELEKYQHDSQSSD